MILSPNKQTILIVIIHHFESGMLKIFEFYVLLLFTVGYHGNQNICFLCRGGMYILYF